MLRSASLLLLCSIFAGGPAGVGAETEFEDVVPASSGPEEIPEFISYLRDNRFAEVKIVERAIDPHAPWKTDATIEVRRSGFFVNDYNVVAGPVRPDLVVSVTVRLNEESRPIPASVTYFDTELGLALISLHTDSTGHYSYYNAKRRKSPAGRLTVASKHESFARDRDLGTLRSPAGAAASNFLHGSARFEQYGSTLAPGGSLMMPTLVFSSYADALAPGDLLMQGGTLRGIVIRFDPARRYGHAIPAPFVRQFCERAMKYEKSGKNRLLVERWSTGKERPANTILVHPGFTTEALKNPQSRSYYGLKPYHQGAVVADVLPYMGATGLERGDVILSAGGRAVGPDGTLADPVFGRLPLEVALGLGNGRFQSPGRRLTLRIAREGQQKDVNVKLAEFSQANLRVPVYEPLPQYAVIGGLVFVELSREYLAKTPDAPDRLKYLADSSRYLDAPTRNRYVVLDRILPTSDDLGYAGDRLLVESVNNIAIRDVAHLYELVERLRANGDAAAFRLEGNRTLVLAPATIERKNADVRARYGIQYLQHTSE